MALFVHPENQKILWNIISGNPFIIQYFGSKPPEVKANWFKQSIEDFYKQLQGKQINPQELNNLNKEVLTNMIQNVHLNNPEFSAHNSSNAHTPTSNSHTPTSNEYGSNRYSDSNNQWQSSPSQQYQNPINEPVDRMNTINTPPLVNESKEDIFNNQFKMRRQEYDNLLQRKTPDEINFRDPVSDENKDINELLERERRDREELMNPVQPVQPNNKINIQGDNNITLEAVELYDSKEKKSVSWDDNNNKMNNIHELFEVKKSEMYSMRLHIIELSKQLEITNKHISELELHLHENNPPKSEKIQHVTSKYANLEENNASVDIQNTGDVLVETVESDSDSTK